jgi:DNA-directed RNA polymerase specialized sigma24 family protein
MSKQFAKDKQYLYPGITQDDVEQECNRIGLESLPEFDPSRANIKTFLFLKMKTKLLNWKRDNYYRPGTKTDYKKKINSAEQLDLDIWEDLPDNDHSKDMFLLEESIPSELRDDWHRLKEGIPISVKQKSKILKVVRQIIYEEIHEGTDKQIDKQTGKEIG